MGDHPTTVLALRAQLREADQQRVEAEERCAELRSEVEEWRDIVDAKEWEIVDLREEVDRLTRELRNRERDTWRPHR